MNADRHYITAFGATLDLEMASAIRAGMSLEAIYLEMSERTRELAEAIVSRQAAQQRKKEAHYVCQ